MGCAIVTTVQQLMQQRQTTETNTMTPRQQRQRTELLNCIAVAALVLTAAALLIMGALV